VVGQHRGQVEQLVIVLGLAVEQLAEAAGLEQVPRVDALLVVVARLGHHVLQPGLLLDLLEHGGLLHGHAGGHGRDHVPAPLHAPPHVLGVVRGAGEDRHGVDVFGLLEHDLQRVVDLVALVVALQARAPRGIQVGHAGHHAVGVLVPVEAGAEAAAHHAHADLLATFRRVGPTHGAQRRAGRHEARRRRAGQLQKRASREARGIGFEARTLLGVTHSSVPSQLVGLRGALVQGSVYTAGPPAANGPCNSSTTDCQSVLQPPDAACGASQGRMKKNEQRTMNNGQ